MPNPDAPKGMQYRIAPDVIRVAAARVFGSQTFKAAKQQELLLRFLIDEHLAARATHGSQNAAISEFFADRSPEEASKKLMWAMERLSEKLAVYYADDGADDPIRITTNSDLCGLNFQMWEDEAVPSTSQPQKMPMKGVIFVGLILVALVVGGGLALWPENQRFRSSGSVPVSQSEEDLGVPPFPERYDGLSVFELEKVAREYLYPTLDMERQRVAIAIAKEVIARDPEYVVAYATAGYGLTAIALMTSGGALSRRHLEEARLMRDQALAKGPEDPWVLSSAALVAFTERDYRSAINLSERSYALGSQDPDVAGAYAVLALLTSRYENAREATEVGSVADLPHTLMARERLYAMASFHVGEYVETIETLETSEREGRGVNVVTMTYLAAAHQASGNHQRASETVQHIREQWPMFRPEMIGRVFFQDPTEGDFLMQNLAAAGWTFID
ncbi:tetratricopeptide repeat protein [Shimia sagamensis]|uniref:Tetratricopeptide repeat protein n=1 Tax=Shimia sagamensis TaxID=1566352 RepID=A0ABY1N7H1_9RHOB|nr:tetratricopeptide repeat protein [Shimia sagamensis]SMP02081.1 hypothetical protein SAMN06265373_101207 [Shimia sagamensis]